MNNSKLFEEIKSRVGFTDEEYAQLYDNNWSFAMDVLHCLIDTPDDFEGRYIKSIIVQMKDSLELHRSGVVTL
jgi:hypothetical protein